MNGRIHSFLQKQYFYPKSRLLNKLLPFLLFIFLLNKAYSQDSNLEKNLTYLSSDELKGRENGTQEATECAFWIAEQFKEIGLTSPSFTDNYLQKVNLLTVRNVFKKLNLNDVSISDSAFFTLGQFEKISINSELDFNLFLIGENDDLTSAFAQIKEYNSSYAVFIHPAHQKRFERLKRYFTKENLELDRGDDSFSLWLLSDVESIENIQLISRNEIDRLNIYNVIGVLPAPGGLDRKWIFSAHYDHIGIINEVNGDSIANGADDDASGVATVIELARKFKNGPQPEKAIYFVAFAGEELGLFGSKYLANTLNSDSIEALLNFEMVGKVNMDLGPESVYISGFDLTYLPQDMANNINDDNFMIFPDPYPHLNLFTRSDNAPFAAYGIAAHSVSSYSETDHTYHQVNDELELIDVEHMEKLINEIYNATLPLLNLTYDPGLIDFKTKNDR
jgi:hypothetical protein